MKSWRGQLSFVGLATLAVAMLVHGCESPEPFHLDEDAAVAPDSGGDNPGSGGITGTGGRPPTGTTASGGRGPTGMGGRPVGGVGGGTPASVPGSGGITGSGGVPVGSGGRTGFGSGGLGGRAVTASGGAPTGFGGRVGTGATGGRASTGGAGGRTTAAGGRAGTGGAGGRGGRSGAGGRGVVGMSGNCIDEIQANGYSAGAAPSCSACNDNGKSLQTQCEAVIDCMAPLWPCTGNCLTQCYNMAGASGPVMSCVSALTTAACGG